MKKSESSKKSPKTVRHCEVTTRLQKDDGTSLFDLDKMQEVIDSKLNCISQYAWIVHDKDTYSPEKEAENPDHKAGTVKPPHVHLMLHFKDDQPQQFDLIPAWFDLEPQYVRFIKRKWVNAVGYLVHANAPEKYQYDFKEVHANFDVKATLDLLKKESKLYLNSIYQRILSGEIREYNKTLEIDNIILISHSREINEAFKIRAEYLQATKLERNTEVIFITGPAGCGKTTFAKKIARERGLAYFVSSGSNDIMDGYGQQPCLIIDDARPSSMGLSDFLKLLDNNTPSSVKSRYKNKYLNCDLIIITTVLSIDDFYNNVFENEKEPVNQLKRRCRTLVHMNPIEIAISRWDSTLMRYSEPLSFENTVLQEYLSEPKTKEEVKAEITQLFPFLTPLDVSVKPYGGFKLGPSITKASNGNTISDKQFREVFPKKEPPAIDTPDWAQEEDEDTTGQDMPF